MMTLGQKITYFRKKRGLTQKELAEKAGVSQGAIGQYEIGLTMPRLSTLQRIAVALDTTASELCSP